MTRLFLVFLLSHAHASVEGCMGEDAETWQQLLQKYPVAGQLIITA
jgi:hypothetical protein